jgi:putative flippase GtrA
MATKKKSSSKSNPSLVKQGAKFGLVGISNTIIDYTLYITFTTLLQVPLDRVYIVKFFSGTAAMINSFYWNRRWVFASRADIGSSGIKFLTATLVSVYAIQPGMVKIFSSTEAGQGFGEFWFHLAQLLGITALLPSTITEEFVIKTVAFGMGVVGSAIWNFTLYKLWAFKE